MGTPSLQDHPSLLLCDYGEACTLCAEPDSLWDFSVLEEETEARSSAFLPESSGVTTRPLTSYPEPRLIYRDWDPALLSSRWVDFLSGRGGPGASLNKVWQPCLLGPWNCETLRLPQCLHEEDRILTVTQVTVSYQVNSLGIQKDSRVSSIQP